MEGLALGRAALVMAVCSLGGVSIAGCVVGQKPAPAPQRAAYAPPNAANASYQANPNAVRPEAHRPRSPRQKATGLLFLAGSQNQRLVSYDVVDGVGVIEGDILLGPANTIPLRYGLPWAPATNVRSAVATASRSHLWPKGEIPYVIDGTVTPDKIAAIHRAIAHLNQTELEIRPRRAADADYVVFNASGDGCSSYLGRIGGPQEIQVAECGEGSVIHELLHAAGFYHEQSRGDRDEHVTIMWDEIDPAYHSAFDKRDGRGQDIGSYDYGSIMHYGTHGFSRSGRPTIVPKSNVRIGQREGISQGDRAAISELYGSGAPPGPQPPPPPPGPQPPPPSPGPQPPPPPPGPQPPPQPPSSWNGSFAGSYTSARGDVTCAQTGASVSCQFPGGSMFCQANGARLDCGWTGGGSGRATFQRQSSGLVAGTYGDFFSADSRGKWDLVPAGGAPPPGPGPVPPPAPQPTASAPLAGNYASTRGAMTCSESGASLGCTFKDANGSGRLDCLKDQSGLQLSCTWLTFLPPGSGRATFRRSSTAERNLTGTWGHFHADTGGGAWELRGQ